MSTLDNLYQRHVYWRQEAERQRAARLARISGLRELHQRTPAQGPDLNRTAQDLAALEDAYVDDDGLVATHQKLIDRAVAQATMYGIAYLATTAQRAAATQEKGAS